MTSYLSAALLLWNITVFFIYAMDKLRAAHGGWRVSERTLLLCAFLGGGLGAFVGMLLLRHKTRHLRFRILLPVAAALTLAAYAFLLWPHEIFAAVRVLLRGERT